MQIPRATHPPELPPWGWVPFRKEICNQIINYHSLNNTLNSSVFDHSVANSWIVLLAINFYEIILFISIIYI